MPRHIPPRRFDDLLRAAEETFISQGYARAQMDDVAKALGVAKGTLYQYVESKQALFDFVVRHTDSREAIAVPDDLPLRTPRPGATLRVLQARMADAGGLPLLERALASEPPDDLKQELAAIVREFFDLLLEHRTAIKLLDRCSRDYPELHAIWHTDGRYAVVGQLAELIARRTAEGCYHAGAEPRVAARFVLEIVTTWAVHVRWDPAPQAIDDDTARDTAVQFACAGLLHAPAPDSNRRRRGQG